MNWRAVGCGTLAAAVFIAVGLIGIWRAGAPAACPPSLPYQPAAYAATGPPTGEPALPGVDGPLERRGSASFGLAAWPVWVDPAEAPTPSAGALPARIVLECGDGTFQSYRRGDR